MELEETAARLKRLSGEDLTAALDDLYPLLRGDIIPEEMSAVLVDLLVDRLKSAEKENRLKILSLLRNLASANDISKEKLAELGSLSIISQSLMSEMEEKREAALLLSDLVGVVSLSQRIGRIHGCVLMLVTLLNGDDHLSSVNAEKILEFLSSQTQNVLLMAEAGYFKPMIQHLKRGSAMNKILMATAISRMELTEQKKVALGNDCMKPLIDMFLSGKLEAKFSALAAIQKLCSSPENVEILVNSGFTTPLLHLLYSVTSVLMTLQEPAAAILSLISQSPSILKNKILVPSILSLISTSNSIIKTHLLHALKNITSMPGSLKAKKVMGENGTVDLLLTLISEDQRLRSAALSVLFNLSKDLNLAKDLSPPHLNLLIKVITESEDPEEKSSACGILSNIPSEEKNSTSILLRANTLPIFLSLLKETTFPSLLDNVVGILIRFTVPWDIKLQRTAAEQGAIQDLVKLISEDKASPLAKSRAATCLAQMSQNSFSLSKLRGKKSWAAWVSPAETKCVVHGGKCSVRATFCLEKAGAVGPLVELARCDNDISALKALLTLLPEGRSGGGSDLLERNFAVEVLVGVVERGERGSVEERETALRVLERMLGNDGVRERCGGRVQSLVVDLVREGDPEIRLLVGKILGLLGVLPVQQSYHL